jgi:thymidylate synthase ThyX
MVEAYMASQPRMLASGEWHLPYVSDEERANYPIEVQLKLSTARCARVSYLTHEGKTPEVDKDIVLHDRLAESGHWSPFEHQAQAMWVPVMSGNFFGWSQYRKGFPNEVRSFEYKR